MKRIVRRIIVFLLVLCLLAPILLLVFHRPISRLVGPVLLRSVAGSYLGIKASVERLEAGLDGTIMAENFSASGEGGLTPIETLTLGNVRIELSLRDVFDQPLKSIRRLEIDGWHLVYSLDKEWPAADGGEEESSEEVIQSLPEVKLSNGQLVLRKGEETWQLEDIDVKVVNGDFQLTVESISTPLPSLTQKTESGRLTVQGSLGRGENLFRQIEIGLARLADEELLRDAKIRDLADSPKISGRLPFLNGEVDLTLEPSRLLISVAAQMTEFKSLISWVAQAPNLAGHLSFSLNADIPLDDPEKTTLIGHLLFQRHPDEASPEAVEEIAVQFDPTSDGILAHAKLRNIRPWQWLVSLRVLEESLAADLKFLEEATLAGDLHFVGKVDPREPLKHLASWKVGSRGKLLNVPSEEILSLDKQTLASLRIGEVASVGFAWEMENGQLHVESIDIRAEPSFLRLESIVDLAHLESNVVTAIVGFEGEAAGLPIRASDRIEAELNTETFSLHVDPVQVDLLGGQVNLATEDSQWEAAQRLTISGKDLQLERIPIAKLREYESKGVADFSGAVSWHSKGADTAPEFQAVVQGKLRDASFRVEDNEVGGLAVETDLSLETGEVHIRTLKLLKDNDRVELSGAITTPTFEDNGGAVSSNLDLEVKIADLSQWFPTFRQVREISGSFDGKASIKGNIERPELRAELTLHGVSIRFPGEIGTFSEIDGRVELAGAKLSLLDKLQAKHNGSPIMVGGELELAMPWETDPDEFPIRDLNLNVLGENLNLVPARSAKDYRVRGDLNLKIAGPWQSMRISGVVVVQRALFFKNVKLLPSNNPLPFDLFSIQEPESLKNLQFDVAIRCNQNLFLKNNIIRSRGSLNLVLKGTGQAPILVGRIFTDQGSVRIPGTSLKIQGAMIEFLESEPFNPHLQVSLANRMRGYDVSIAVTGTFEQPEVYLDSFPPLEREKILILVTTGYTLDEINQKGTEEVAAVQGARYLGFLVTQYFSSNDSPEDSFFSRFSLESEGARTIEGEDLIRLEYKISDHFFLQSERDYYGDFNFNVGARLKVK